MNEIKEPHLLFKLDIVDSPCFIARYEGVFYRANSAAGFAFLNEQNNIECLYIEKTGQISARKELALPRVVLPSAWRLLVDNDKQVLICPADRYLPNGAVREYPGVVYALEIDGRNMTQVDGTPYLNVRWLSRSYYYDAPFVFGDYVVEHVSEFMYCCHKANSEEILWKLKVRGYLYSDIICTDNVLIINTAGAGGYVYGVDVGTGTVIYEIKTGNTSGIAVKDNRLLVLVAGKKGALLTVDIHSGEMISSTALPSINQYSRVASVNDDIFVLAFAKNTSSREKPVILCFSDKRE